MKKRYCSPCMKYTVNIKVDGKPMAIVFTDYDRDSKKRTIVISDTEIQNQMEKSDAYNTYFWIDEIYDNVEEEIQVNDFKNEIKEVETLADAKKYLSGLGVKVYPSMNKEKAIEAAKEKQIELIIKK